MERTYVYMIVPSADTSRNHKEVVYVGKIINFDLGFDQQLLLFGRTSLLGLWPDNVKVNVVGDEPNDLVMCSPWMEMVSERAKNIMEKFPLDQVEFLPITVYDSEGKEYSRMKYWVMHVYKVIADAMDWEYSRWTVSPPPGKGDPKVMGFILKPAFYLEKVQNLHLFQFEVSGKVYGQIYISAVLKRALEKEKCSMGIGFNPIRTT